MKLVLTFAFLAYCGLLSTTSAAYLKGFVSDDAESEALIDTDGIPGRRLVYCDMEDRMENDLKPDYIFSCYCGGIGSRNSGLLGTFCTDTCKICPDAQHCATATVWAYMNSNFRVTSMFNTLTYQNGDRINIAKYDCSSDPNDIRTVTKCGRCTVKVNYQLCESCQLETKTDYARYPWGGAVNFKCGNIGYGSYDLSTNPSIPTDDVFAVLLKSKQCA